MNDDALELFLLQQRMANLFDMAGGEEAPDENMQPMALVQQSGATLPSGAIGLNCQMPDPEGKSWWFRADVSYKIGLLMGGGGFTNGPQLFQGIAYSLQVTPMPDGSRSAVLTLVGSWFDKYNHSLIIYRYGAPAKANIIITDVPNSTDDALRVSVTNYFSGQQIYLPETIFKKPYGWFYTRL